MAEQGFDLGLYRFGDVDEVGLLGPGGDVDLAGFVGSESIFLFDVLKQGGLPGSREDWRQWRQ